jgi:predicted DNA-binding protein with PD1-like motif
MALASPITSCHLHISVSDESGRTIGGHLLMQNLIYTTAEIVVAVLPDLIFDRETDQEYHYTELVVRRADRAC